MLLPRPIRVPLTWSLRHGLPRAFMRREARHGRPLARLVTTPELIADPRPVWEEVRAAGPMMRGPIGWLTADYAIGSAVTRSEHFGMPQLERALPGRVTQSLRDPYALGPVDAPSLLALDAPDHTRLRRLVARSFTARRVTAMRPAVERTAAALLDDIEARRRTRFDLIEEYAARLPIAIIADLLGVPEDERGPLLGWGNAAAALLDAGLPWGTFRDAERGIREMHLWVEQHLERLRAEPGDDLLSGVLATVEQLPEEERPTETELRALALLVLGAGFETTVNLIGNAVAMLSAHPDQLHRLQETPDLWPTAVEEVLRLDSPVTMTARLAHRDVDLATLPGLTERSDLPTVRRGQVVVTILGAMNRDPAVFEDPDRFDVDRANAGDHVAFSAGAHFCIGAGLARLEAEVGLRALYDRFPELRVDGVPRRRDLQILRGYEELPVSR